MPVPIPILLLLLSVLLAEAALINVTVDDAGVDQSTGLGVSYSPLADWNARTATSDCSECVVNLDPSQLYMGTWHDATYDGPNGPRTEVQSATFEFNGSAIYIYGTILTSPLIPLGDTGTTSLGFLVDNVLVKTFNNTPPGDGSQPTTYKYNILLYSNTSMSQGPHTFVLQNGLDGGSPSLILFDYLVYSTEHENATSTTSSSTTPLPTSTSPTPTPTQTPQPPASHSNTLVKVLPAVFGVLAVIVIIIFALLWRRRRSKHHRPSAPPPPPAVDLLAHPLSEANLHAHDGSHPVSHPGAAVYSRDSTPPLGAHAPLLAQTATGPSTSTFAPSYVGPAYAREQAFAPGQSSFAPGQSSFEPGHSSGPSSSGPSAYGLAPWSYPAEKLRSPAYPQGASQLGRNASLGVRSDGALSDVPPPYSSDIGDSV